MTKQIQALLVGMHFNPPAKAVLAALPIGAIVTLTPEPENPYDSRAIRVWVDRDQVVEEALDEAMLAGMGFTVEDVLKGEGDLALGHIAASGGKPLIKANQSPDGAGVLVGTEEVHAAVADEWPTSARLEFRENGTPIVVVTSVENMSNIIDRDPPNETPNMTFGSDSMGKMSGLRPRWQELPLTLTFRCPKVIVARQQKHAPGFRAAESNAEGHYSHWPEFATDSGASGAEFSPEDHIKSWGWGDIVKALPAPDSSIAVLCRNNGPLMGLAFKLLRIGIGVVMLGRDIGRGLVALSRKIEPDDRASIVAFARKLFDWEEHESSLARANSKDEKLAGIADRAEALRAVASGSNARDVGDLRASLEKLFARESGAVTLGSIHRSKGLEWDLVIHLDPWRVPSRQAKRRALAGDTRALEQEWNLKYVCETRTRHTLIEANLEDFR